MTKTEINKYIKQIASAIKRPIVIYDLETSSADTSKAGIVQFGALRINPDATTKELNFKCNPEVPIEPAASAVNGIKDEDVKNLPTFKHFSKDVVEIFKDADIAGYNCISFDNKIIIRKLEECGYKNIFDNKITYDGYIKYQKDHRRRLTEALVYYTGQSITNFHTAEGDILACLAVIASQIDRENKSIAEIIESLNPKQNEVDLSRWIIKDKDGNHIINFSKKHKNERLDKVDKGFLKWILGQDFPKQVKDIIKKYI